MTSYRSDISRRLAMAGMAAASAMSAWAQTRAMLCVLALAGDRCHNPFHPLVAERSLSH